MNTKQTAVEYVIQNVIKKHFGGGWLIDETIKKEIEQAKEIENNTKLRNQLFIGKIHEVLGYDKTIELLKECYKEYPI